MNFRTVPSNSKLLLCPTLSSRLNAIWDAESSKSVASNSPTAPPVILLLTEYDVSDVVITGRSFVPVIVTVIFCSVPSEALNV